MYKNQLQELAQRSCFNLPCYTCIREGPDHAPRFKATVSFNGEVFESPGYHSTLRQAEHAAAEVAITTLSQRGPTQSLAARILDETGVCKNLLQETAQRSGLSLPLYNTIRTGPKHLPLFKCVVEIGGRHFKGKPAMTKKQAEKNAATAAWSALNQSSTLPHGPLLLERADAAENGEVPIGANELHGSDGRLSYQNTSSHGQSKGRSRPPTVVRDRNRQFYPCVPSRVTVEPSAADRSSCVIFNQLPGSSSMQSNHEKGQRFVNRKQSSGTSSLLAGEANFDSLVAGRREGALHHAHASTSSSRRQGRRHQRRHSLSGMESSMLSREVIAASRASAGGSMLGRVMFHHQQQQIRGLPYQSLSERFELKRPSLLEELQQREEEDDWLYGEQVPFQTPTMAHRQNLPTTTLVCAQGHPVARMPLQSQSERFELKMHQLASLEEVHCKNDEEWLCPNTPEGNSRHGKEKSHDFSYGHADGRWLREGPVWNGDPESTNQTEGWMRGHMLKQSLDVEGGHGHREGWFGGGSSHQSSEKERDTASKQDCAYGSYGYRDGWPSKETVGPIVENNLSQSQDRVLLKALQGDKAVHNASSSGVSSFASPFSSLWSKSAQWWGSHMPSNTSSAAAAVASSLGFRPPRTAAPVVKVRQTVPVYSAPPPRHPNTSGWRHPSHCDSVHLDNESETCQAITNLRI